ncbi:MAG: PDZ domain-containing protein [Opitutaceae bacterium]|jgi:S1-C subfamily serine protease|nr:PDZ domain-containing protein [Opitutaceae bacterium]NBR59109.1 PDZ domain-containing protein [Opitutaceae bacterium]
MLKFVMKKIRRRSTITGWLLVSLTTILGYAEAASPDTTITLPKFEVKSNAVCSYGIGIVATWNKTTQSIDHVYIEEVSPDSTAAGMGLVRGDEILTINGRKVTAMKGGMKRGSDLFELLVNQPVGRTIVLEVAVRAVKRFELPAGL